MRRRVLVVGRAFMTETIWFLKRFDLFERLTPAETQRLEKRAIMRDFAPRDIIYFPTDLGQSVLLLARGRVKIKSLTLDGKETIFAFIEEGELFGEFAAVDNAPRNEYAEAVLESRVVVLPRDDVVWLMEQRPEIALRIMKLHGFRRRRVENRLRNIMFRNNRERIVALLVELVESHGKQVGEGVWEIPLPLSHQDLANLIGATRETVTLTLGRLQAERLIKVQRRRITVLKLRQLTEEASGDFATGSKESNSPSPVNGTPTLRPRTVR
jgi:CRP/FNR family cyclic AMP-dependent transcriptional regulator